MNPLHTWLLAATFAAVVPAQTPDPAAALAKAQLLEQQEGDLAAAQQAYRALLDDAAASAVHAQAALRLGTLLWRLEQKDAAKPFLERAVAAGGEVGAVAAAVLQGLGDAKLAEEQRIKAEALVARYRELQRTPRVKDQLPTDVGMRCSEIERDLQSLGAIGAQAAVAGAKAEGKNDAETRTVRGALLALLWRIGGTPAIEALRTWSKSSDVAVRREIAEACQHTKVANDLEPVLLEYVRDPDPAGDVWRATLGAVALLGFEEHWRMVAEGDPASRAAGLLGLASSWNRLTNAQQEHVVGTLGTTIQQATTASDSRLARSAWQLMARFTWFGPRSAAGLFLAVADRFPNDTPLEITRICQIDADDAWIHAAAILARKLGHYSAAGSMPGARLLAAMLGSSNAKWSPASADDVVTLLELGYAELGQGCVGQLLAIADAGQLRRLFQLWPLGRANLRGMLGSRPLPPEVFPTLSELTEQCLAGRLPRWTETTTLQRRIRGNDTSVAYNENVVPVLYLVHATQNPEAASWLGELATHHPVYVGWCVNLLLEWSRKSPGKEVHTALRKLLVWEGAPENELQAGERAAVFAELARAGDVEAIPLFPRAYELGLANHRPPGLLQGLGFLANIGEMVRNADSKPFHGYGDADLARAWRVLLESPQAPSVWSDLGVDGNEQRNLSIPLPVLPLLCEHLPAIWRHAPDVPTKNVVQRNACRAFSMLHPHEIPTGSPLREALGKLLRTDDATLAQAVFRQLWPDVAQQFADEGRDILRRTTNTTFFDTLMRASIELRDDDWVAVLTNAPPDVRYRALDQIPAAAATRLRKVVEAQLADAEENVRIGACKAMQRVFGDDSVTQLLPLLQDVDETVRKQARASLDQLKQEHEQRTFWAGAKSGIDTSRAGAAAKLLAQAKAGEDKTQRLLAIQSLAVLAAAESLPYLIDWTKDQDRDIATAARTAIQQIHHRADTTTPAKVDPAKK